MEKAALQGPRVTRGEHIGLQPPVVNYLAATPRNITTFLRLNLISCRSHRRSLSCRYVQA